MTIEEELEPLDEKYADIVVKEPLADLPEGRYQVKVLEARVEHSKAGRLQFVTIFEVLSGEHAGATQAKFQGLDSDIGLEIAKNDLHRMNLDLDKISDLPKLTPMLIGLTLEITVVRKAGKGDEMYTNVYINKALDIEAPDPVNDVLRDSPF